MINKYTRSLESLLLLANNQKIPDIDSYSRDEKSHLIIMSGFLHTSIQILENLLFLLKSNINSHFPTTTGYILVRPLFEIVINSRYINIDPKNFVKQYVEYGSILLQRKLLKIDFHRSSKKKDWQLEMETIWNEYPENLKNDLNNKYKLDLSNFIKKYKDEKDFDKFSWSGKKLSKMAEDVDLKEEYDIIYSELCSYTHIDVMVLSKNFRYEEGLISWNLDAKPSHIINILRYSVMFFSDLLELFGEKFNTWNLSDIDKCMKIE